MTRSMSVTRTSGNEINVRYRYTHTSGDEINIRYRYTHLR